jgi:hypothetical protein
MDLSQRWFNVHCLVLALAGILVFASAGQADAHAASQSDAASTGACVAGPLALDAILSLVPREGSITPRADRQGESDNGPVATPSSGFHEVTVQTVKERKSKPDKEQEGKSRPPRVKVEEELVPVVAVARDANQAEKSAALSTINQYLACLDAGEYLRAFALVTPSHLRAILANWGDSRSVEEIAAALSAPPLALQGDGQHSFAEDDLDVKMLVDGTLFVKGRMAVVILEKTNGDYHIADVELDIPDCPTCFIIIPEEDRSLMAPSPSPAFVSLMATPTETNPTPLLVVASDTDLLAQPEFSLESLRELPRGARLSVTSAPIRNRDGIWIPVRVDELVGYVHASKVVPFSE